MPAEHATRHGVNTKITKITKTFWEHGFFVSFVNFVIFVSSPWRTRWT